ncbi:MAG: nucleotidyltransferase family protein [Oscillospiraceae bacterium]|nr:nucleotidyltransferase family protein [Oscillospiraceae bacterium]
MRSVGIICEYNPFHNGHARQLRLAREAMGEDCAVVCLMSGNYVQRGEPAIFPKQLRAEAAVLGGADLVLELPLTAALSSAEGFADRGVAILTDLGCEALCFGAETDDENLIMSTARANLDPAFDALLRAELATGCSYPTARQRALEKLQIPPVEPVGAELEESRMYAHIGPLSEKHQPSVLSNPNDILAVEYCKAILRRHSPLRPLPIHRPGSYHAAVLDPDAPSATALRAALEKECRDEHCSSGIRNECDLSETNPETDAAAADKQCLSLQSASDKTVWTSAVPSCLHELYVSAPIHRMAAGERAVLAILRTLPDATFEQLPFGSEGLWSKLMKNCRSCASVEEILEATKSKRYTRTRIQRMLLCSVLGLTASDLDRTPPYVRVLAFNDRGRAALREMKARHNQDEAPETKISLVNAGETPPDQTYYALESRAADLYSLFSASAPRPAAEEARLRIVYIPASP